MDAPADLTTEGPRWRRRPDVFWRRIDAGLLLLPAGAAEPVLLDGSAPVMWELLAEPATTADAVSVLAEVYGLTESAIGTDVEQFLALLESMDAATCE